MSDYLLSPDGHYVCPVCRHGQISQLTLMDAFACSFCRHMFELSYSEQIIRVLDGPRPSVWRWLGNRWTALGQQPETPVIWGISLVLAILPFSLIGMATYIFPPLPGSRGAWLPEVWAIGALVIHGLMATWIVAEHHQPAVYAANKVRLSRLLQRG
ncbi:MAG: hypothetical protein ACFB5Z_16835 [Elainellaceae cyanobacterium]